MPSPSVALLRTQSDVRLVALAAAGHERAFEAIVERYRRQLLRHARRYLPEARAEDALQQALVSAWTGLRRGDEVRELRPWLHRIVHNSALNALRAPGYDYDELRATLQGSGGPAELAERRAVVHGTLAGLAALPERQREALLRIAVEGRSQDEVAEQLGLSQGAVRQLVHRARTALRAAATAVMPLPLAAWLATAGAGRDDVAVRIGELVAGAGGSATLAKAGAVAAIAGSAVAGPAVVHDVSERGARSPTRAAASVRAGDERASTDSKPAAIAPSVPVTPDERRDAPRPAGSDDDRPARGEADDGSPARGDGEGSGSRGSSASGGHGDDDRGSRGDEPDRRGRHERGSRGDDDEPDRGGDDGESDRRGGDYRGSPDDDEPAGRDDDDRTLDAGEAGDHETSGSDQESGSPDYDSVSDGDDGFGATGDDGSADGAPAAGAAPQPDDETSGTSGE